MYKGNFRTAYLQTEVPEPAIVTGDMVVGELVKVIPATAKLPAIYEKLAATTLAAAKEELSHLMAQSDMTLGYGHVPVEDRDYRYFPNIKASIDTAKVAPAASASGAEFLGVYEGTAALPSTAAAVTAGDTALVLANDGITLEKYAAAVQSNTVTWSKATSDAAYSITLINATKPVAAFYIYNVDDINIMEA